MERYLIFGTLAEFNAVNGLLDTAFGYPNEETKTITYAEPVEHPSNGQLAMVITDEALEHLSAEQQSATITSLSSDWSPPPPMDLE